MGKHRPANAVLAVILALAVGGAMACGPADAPTIPAAAVVDTSASTYATKTPAPDSSSTGTFKLLAKAKPDECFYGVGVTGNGPIPAGGCAAGGQTKVNQAYVWGLTLSGTTLWFGTAPNVHCLVVGGYLGFNQESIMTNSYVCEFGKSWAAGMYGLPAEIGDWRPPQIFRYDLMKKTAPLSEMTTSVVNTETDPAAQQRLATTLGLRSAGSLGSVVFLAGPGMPSGVNVFAFDSRTNTFLGSHNFAEYTNIRKWLVVNDVLYTGVAAQNSLGQSEGRILRWSGTSTDLWNFTEVATVGSDAAELAYHAPENRIFVSTWPAIFSSASPGTLAGLYMSPPIPEGGLTAADLDTPWTKVWEASEYEPDPVTAATYAGGALASFGGYLYWGTMHVPFLASEAHFSTYDTYYSTINGGGDLTEEQLAAGLAGTQRAIAIFRGHNFTTAPQLELLYGETSLPVFVPTGDPATDWTMQPTGMGAPLYGPSGFGNYFNNYTWAMTVFKDRLFVGTMDWSYLAEDARRLYEQSTGQTLPIEFPKGTFGADLWMFKSTGDPATALSEDGLGNFTNYGIRTTAVTTDALFFGMANPMNLMTSTTDKLPEGGWELVRMK